MCCIRSELRHGIEPEQYLLPSVRQQSTGSFDASIGGFPSAER